MNRLCVIGLSKQYKLTKIYCGFSNLRRNMSSQKQQVMDVIVIGCGASGIAALRRLHDAGLKVLGLEAAERIGGRIHTVPFGEGVVDIGAAWCHGEKDNIVFEMVNPLGLLGRPEPDNKWFVLSDGELVPSQDGEKIINALDEELGKAEKSNTKSISESIRNAAKSNEILTKNPKLTESFLEWYERNNHVGGQSDPRQGKSLHGLVEFWNSEGELMLNWKGRGYWTILDILLNKYPDPTKEIPVKIVLHKDVETITWRVNSPELDLGNQLVQIRCKDGSLYAAKSVIVTIPVAVLKERYTQLFKPPLPAEKVNSINSLQTAVLDKIYVEFDKPWWPKSPAHFSILWQDEDKAKFTGEDEWITHVYGLQTITNQKNVLLAWIYGEGAEKMEKVSVEGVKAGIVKLLDVVFKKQFEVTQVKEILRTKWRTNRWARGTYSYRSVATEENGGSAITLSEPLYYGEFPVVCFAGEATSYHRHSAVHGAVEAGFREADRLIESFKKLGK